MTTTLEFFLIVVIVTQNVAIMLVGICNMPDRKVRHDRFGEDATNAMRRSP
ncbi:hypothetical protein [Rhodococcus artemisiae]|uniref:Uncharacterized protein n=1 Tax=Rhodococcus artemisiae TaxID=714159 RepID=A0ABU7L9P5_9NOCA|nr:hypothetical protein [Rhodococcus artemisiae]MEE2058265.1 hypothetical protein [Rhodococcus artemisiae]